MYESTLEWRTYRPLCRQLQANLTSRGDIAATIIGFVQVTSPLVNSDAWDHLTKPFNTSEISDMYAPFKLKAIEMHWDLLRLDATGLRSSGPGGRANARPDLQRSPQRPMGACSS